MGIPIFIIILITLFASTATADAPPYVYVRAGDLPLVLSAPHDGELDRPGLPARVDPGGADDFVAVRDLHSRLVLFGVANKLFRLTGRRPYLVVDYLNRRYMDPNRMPGKAFQHPLGGRVYADYHAALDAACRDVRARFGGGLLLDLHGHVSSPEDLIPGTRDGATLSPRARRALEGPGGLEARLAGLGYTLLRGNKARLNGGATVALHGAAAPGGIDAIQLEVHRRIRFDPAARLRLSRDLAAALAEFLALYDPRSPAGRAAVIR